jgi:RNA polymerase primary sigma factor
MNRIHHAQHGNSQALAIYLREVAAQPALTPEQLESTTQLAAGGDVAAQESLVRSHLPLVVGLSRPYAGYGLPLSDLISEGNIGLIRAAQLFDPRFGTKFSTYAAVWIKQRIHRAITAQGRAVRIPVWRSQRLRKVARLNDELASTLGRAPTEEELAARLGLTVEELADIAGDRVQVASLDATVDPEDDNSLRELDRLADESAPDPAAALTSQELHEELVAALHDLDDRELDVVSSKFGLGNRAARSFREIGRSLGKSHEWIRRIAELALVKLHRGMSVVAKLPVVERLRRRMAVRERIAKLSERWQPQAAA